MSSKLVGSKRLGRARKITDANVKEFKIVNKRPLICYCKIQGSAKSPYTVIIDLESNTVAHSCPDFNRRLEWCKHIGKLLLLLETSDDNYDFQYIDQIISRKPNIRTENARSRISSLLEVIKTEKAGNQVKEIVKVERNEDFFVYFAKQLVEDKISLINDENAIKRVQELFNNDSTLLFLLSFHTISQLVPKRYRSEFDEFIAEMMKNTFEKHFERYLELIWTMNIVGKLELAFLFNDIASRYSYKLDLAKFKLVKDLSTTEAKYLRVTLQILLREQEENLSTLLNNPLLKPYEKYENQVYESIMMKLEFAGSHVDGLIRLIEAKTKSGSQKSLRQQSRDDFLIYCIQTNQEKPKHDFQVNKYRNISYLPRELIEMPATKFALYHIRESDRDYLTKDEINQHRGFFNWLKGGKYTGKWIEKPRNEIHDHFLDTNGIIVQWDINVKTLFSEFLCALDDSTWLIPKKGAIIADHLQPFDYTLNVNSFQYYRPFTEEVNPKHIITPRQVIFLIKQGVKIISNLLPWEVLQRYVNEAFVSSGDINNAIKYCENHQFIYGSIELKGELQKLIKIGKQGPAEKMYKEVHDKLRVDSGRLNMRSREWTKSLLTAEGTEFEKLFGQIPIDEKMKAVIKLARKEKYMEAYQNGLYKEMVKLRFQNTAGLPDFIAHVNESVSSVGTLARKYTHELLRKQLIEFERQIQSSSATRKKLSDNIIGGIIFDELNLPKMGKVTNEDRERLHEYYAYLMG